MAVYLGSNVSGFDSDAVSCEGSVLQNAWSQVVLVKHPNCPLMPTEPQNGAGKRARSARKLQ
jgi:hypothetical protein